MAKLSAKLKAKMLKSKDFSRPLVARNYDSLTFNYKGQGRFQLRFEEGVNQSEIWYNQKPIDLLRWSPSKEIPTLKDIKEALDPYMSELKYL